MLDKRIALTGGIATGKTTVANRFRELGAIILDADDYARKAVEPGTPSHTALRDHIGPLFFNPDGTLRRRELRRGIIREPALRKRINAILHPYITGAMEAEWERQKKLHPQAVIVFDVPLLFEGGFEKDFDIVILAYSTPEVQVQRLAQRDKLSPSEAERTLSMQFPIESKRAHSDYIIENSGEIESTLRQVDEVWNTILKIPS
ncbi:Dephospho-CoA kinase [Syntrophobacter sp. SbD2]|nr:Dephospho-CoA kinase [Syntrophobacter sp. SbD2]